MIKLPLASLFFASLAACASNQPSAAEPLASPIAAAPLPSCDDPELWLGHFAIRDLGANYCASPCASHCAAGDDGQPVMPWAFLDADPSRWACSELDRVAGKVRADRGAALGEAGKANLGWLEAAADICRRDRSYKLALPYRARVLAWLKARPNGALPVALFVDGQPASRDDFIEFLIHGDEGHRYFNVDEGTPIRAEVVTRLHPDDVETRILVEVDVGVSWPRLSCLDTSGIDCEGYESILFYFDPQDDALVAISISAAG